MRFKLGEIVDAVGGKLTGGSPESVCNGIGIDTRTLSGGGLFVAIKGAHFDGHDFLGDAVRAGVVALLVREGQPAPNGIGCVVVDDTVKALGDVAGWWRRKFSVPCVAITGSNGKSTTKEMIAAVTASLGPVLKTEGNFNNLIGMPLTIFRWDESHRAAILEMGMNSAGEIARLTGIAKPDVGLITNITSAHLEKLHTLDAVAHAKGELFMVMGEGTTAVINEEDPWVVRMAGLHKGRKITFGMQNTSDVRFLHMETTGLDSMDLKISVGGKEYQAKVPVPGAHNVMNALAAVAVGITLGIDAGDAVARLAAFCPMAMRFERVQLANGVMVVNDSYNANPESMRVAFRTVAATKRAGRFIAALGDMLELGEASPMLHREVGAEAAGRGVTLLYIFGDYAGDVAAGAEEKGLEPSQVVVCDSLEQMVRLIEEEIRTGDVLLVKGSRGMKMERVVEHLKSSIGTG